MRTTINLPSLLGAAFMPVPNSHDLPHDAAGRTIHGYAEVYFGDYQVACLPIYDEAVSGLDFDDEEATPYVNETVAKWLKRRLAE